MKIEIVKVFYTQWYDKENKSIVLKIKLVDKGRVKFWYKSKFESKNMYLAFKSTLIKLFEVLDDIQKEKYRNRSVKFIIWMKNDTALREVSSTEEQYLNSKSLAHVRELIKENKNWELKVENKKNNYKKLNYLRRYKVSKNNDYKNSTQTNNTQLSLTDYDHIVFWDSEMNCSNRSCKYDEIVSIGAIKYNIESKEIDQFYSLVKPTFDNKLSDDCMLITNLTQEEIDKASEIKGVLIQFEQWIGKNKTLFISWSRNDLIAIKHEDNHKYMDLKLINRIYDNYHDFQNEFCNHFFKGKKIVSLKAALELIDVNFIGEAHHALIDAINLFNLYSKYYKKEINIQHQLNN